MHDLDGRPLRVEAVVETAGPTRATWLFPAATPEALDRHRAWLAPHFLDAREPPAAERAHLRGEDARPDRARRHLHRQRQGPRRPAAVPHAAHRLPRGAARRPASHPAAVDVVICTHLHVDHVGWNTRLDDGRWVPTFPRARYLFARREWEHWTSEDDDGTRRILADSVAPVLDAGLAELVEMDHRVSDEIWLEPTPGHTPGHVSVRLASGGADAVITGDLMHHPVQVAEPDVAERLRHRSRRGPGDATRLLRALRRPTGHRARHPLPPSDRGPHREPPATRGASRWASRGLAATATPLTSRGRGVLLATVQVQSMPTHYRGSAQERAALDAYIKLMRAADSVTARLDPLMRAADLTVGQFGALEALLHLGPLCQRDLGPQAPAQRRQHHGGGRQPRPARARAPRRGGRGTAGSSPSRSPTRAAG